MTHSLMTVDLVSTRSFMFFYVVCCIGATTDPEPAYLLAVDLVSSCRMTEKMNPVEVAIREFGGVRKLARAIGRDPAAVSRWRRRGLIPASAQALVYNKAIEHAYSLTAHDLMHGRD